MNIVFILGAGASHEGGCPVMSNFLSKSRELAFNNQSHPIAESYRVVQRAKEVFQHAHAKSVLDTDNIESLFSALEMAELLGGVPALSEKETADAKKHLQRLIAYTLDLKQDIRCQWTTNPKMQLGASGPVDAEQLAAFARRHAESRYGHNVSFVTFNYDVGLEIALSSHGVPYTYCLETSGPVYQHGDPGKIRQPFKLCKLHGSLNWVLRRDPSGESRVDVFDPYSEVIRQCDGKNPKVTQLDSQKGRATLSGGNSEELLPLIVPPGEGKSNYRAVIRNVWREATAALREADVIHIVGYSLPPTDVFFNQLFSLSMIGECEVQKVTINVGGDDNARERIMSLLGPSIRNRRGVLEPGNDQLSTWLKDYGQRLQARDCFY